MYIIYLSFEPKIPFLSIYSKKTPKQTKKNPTKLLHMFTSK